MRTRICRAGVGALLAVGLAACGGGGSGGGRITVATLVDGVATGDCSLRDAISTANGSPVAGSGCRAPRVAAKTIGFARGLSGTIALSAPLPAISGQLTIEGPTDGAAITLSGEQAHRILDIAEDAEVELRNLILAHGEALDGGAAVRNAGGLTIEDCLIHGNHSALGGGALLNLASGDLLILESELRDNGTNSVGGALDSAGGSVTLVDSTIAGNGNGDGGGGAVVTSGSTTLEIDGCTFSGNDSAGSGGALNVGGPTSIVNSTFVGNSANAPGGAIAVSGGSAVTVVASTFDRNLSAPQFPGNTVTVAAGGSLSFKSTILRRAADLFTPICLASNDGPIVNGGYNIASDSSCGFGTSIGAEGQTIGDGVDPLLDPAGLQDNGGPTATVALLDDSPAVTAIPPAECTDADGDRLTTDQRGEPRPRRQPCDIGAYELQ